MKIKFLYFFVLFLFSLFITSCSNNDNNKKVSKFSLEEWQNLPLSKKAELILRTSANSKKSKKDYSEFLHVQTLISLSPPLSKEKIKELEIEKIKLLKINPQWGNYKEELLKLNKSESDKVKQSVTSAPIHIKTERKNIISIDENQLIEEAIRKAATINNTNNKDNILILPENKNSPTNIIDITKNIKKENFDKNNEVKNDSENSLNINISKNNRIKSPVIDKKTLKKQTILYDDGSFPSGKYVDLNQLENLPLGNIKDTYFIGQITVNSIFNNGYICDINTNNNIISNLFNDNNEIIYIKFPFNTDYLKEGSVLFFNIRSPLKINQKIQIKNHEGLEGIQYNCKYYGKTVHAVTNK